MRICFDISNLTIRNTICREKYLLILNECVMIGLNLDYGKNPAIKQRNLIFYRQESWSYEQTDKAELLKPNCYLKF